MKKPRFAASAVAIGFALVATPALAQGKCETTKTAVENVGNPDNANVTNEQAMGQLIDARLPANTPKECRSFIVSESLRLSGLNPTAKLVHGTKMTYVVSVTYTTPVTAPAKPADAVSAPAKVPAGAPGATIDSQIADHERRISALEAGGGNPAEIAALEAEVAELKVQVARRNRDNAATGLQRTVARPGATPAQINTATAKLQAAEKAYSDAKGYAEAAEKSAGASAKSAALAATAQTEAGKSAAAAAKSATWLETNKWMIWAALALAVIALLAVIWIWFRGSRNQSAVKTAPEVIAKVVLPDNTVTREELDGKLAKLATKEELGEVREELHGRVDRVMDDVQLDAASAAALKSAKVGDEVEATFEVNKVPEYRIAFTKCNAKNFAVTAKVGDTPAGQDIGDVLAFVRRAHTARKNALEPFKIA